MNHQWEEHGEEENWGVLLVDAKDAFNQINCRVMLWDVQHLWSVGSRFAFNTYQHWRKLVLQGQDELVYRKEGTSYLPPYLLVFNNCKNGLPRGYIPEPTKSILVAHSKNINNAIDYFDHYNFKIKAGNRYLGGYLGEQELAQAFAAEKVTDWVSSVDKFADMMGQQPQAAFAIFA
eukprot:4912222-Ditylum_brightwellii.AAC.1